jgi:hypothetical protein
LVPALILLRLRPGAADDERGLVPGCRGGGLCRGWCTPLSCLHVLASNTGLQRHHAHTASLVVDLPQLMRRLALASVGAQVLAVSLTLTSRASASLCGLKTMTTRPLRT